MRLAGGVFGEEDSKRRANMRGKRCLLTLTAGAFLFASAMFLLMAAPGFLSDLASIVLVVSPAPEAGR
jgi:UPF0716 family protein affecting phage T7 exclusion